MDNAVTTKEAYGYSDHYEREEQIEGIIVKMMATPSWRHGVINGNIYKAIARELGYGPCEVFIENLGFKYHPDDKDEMKKTDYIVPDVMIACDRALLKNEYYYGIPKFVLETASPSTAKKDLTVKLRIYEKAGVSEYWVVDPVGTLMIFYLVNGKYELEEKVSLCSDKESNEFNADMVFHLREFPKVKMTLGEIFR